MSHNSIHALVILDGLGISNSQQYNAFYQAYTPYLDTWKNQYFYTTLHAAGKFVGLPEGYNGNSEVGHFTIGAGRVIPQNSIILNSIMEQSSLKNSDIITKLLKNFNTDKTVHLLGLVSDGNIHSNINHLKALLQTLHFHNISRVLVHAILDGRDTSPYSAQKYLQEIEQELQHFQYGKIATIHGRFYAMDRNNNTERTQASFDILTRQQTSIASYTQTIQSNYTKQITDEFIYPTACIDDHTINPEDGLFFFNFRPDRAIQITKKLLSLSLQFFITPVIYRKDLPTTALIQSSQADETLIEILSAHHKKIFTIAETEKYAHVTYFLHGHKHISLKQETRTLIPSHTEQDITKYPYMKAQEITQAVIESVQHNPHDFYVINYANADMVGHSGDFDATVKTIEYLDTQLGRLYHEIVIKKQGTLYITADHGNAECMYDTTSEQICTSHTSNPVPFYIISSHQNKVHVHLEGLADITPCILLNMNITIPESMKR